MDKLGDMDLFVRVVKTGGLAAAGREVGLSPARMTARINGLEERYGVRLLHRTTRQVSLTEEGREFYAACERVLLEVEQAELQLQTGREAFAGPLRVTAMSDLGQQAIAPLLADFTAEHPEVHAYLHLSDGVVNIIEDGFDIGIRYGVLDDNRLIARKLASNRRLLCAAPAYLKQHGTPSTPEELSNHACLTMVRGEQPLTNWYFYTSKGQTSQAIKPALSSNDGAMIRRWAIEGAGIALKSYCDVAADIKAKRLVPVMEEYTQDFSSKGARSSDANADLHVVYPSREYLPQRVRAFIDILIGYFSS